jgi:uncharacterized membrane protein YfcA
MLRCWRLCSTVGRTAQGRTSGFRFRSTPALTLSAFSVNSSVPKKETVLLGILGAFSGCIGPLVGVGGGIISIPVWREFTALPQRVLSATSLVAVGVSACAASFAFVQADHVNFGAAGALIALPFVLSHASRTSGWLSCLIVFAALMSISSIFFARWGAKFASRASERVLQRFLGCFMLVSVPFVLAKTLWWKHSVTLLSEQSSEADNRASSTIANAAASCMAAKEKLVTRFRHQLHCGYDRVVILLPQVAALAPIISGTLERLQTAGIQLYVTVQSKFNTEFPQMSAAATNFSTVIGLTEPDSLQRGCAYLLLGAAGGCISGMLGVGGGVVFTPFLAAFSSMPHLTVLGTAMLTMIPATISGTLQHHAAGNILWPQAAALAAGSMLGAAAGSNVALIVSEDALRFVFAAMMSLLGARTLLR